MRVLFVSGIDGFCHRYAVLHRAAQLGRLGVTTAVRHHSDPRLSADVEAHDVVFLYRVPETAHTVGLIERARARDAAIVGSIDDLVFVPDASLFPELDGVAAEERALWLDGVRRYRATLERCDAFVTSTEPLAEEAARIGWRSYVHRNSVSPAELALGELARVRRATARRAAARSSGDRRGIVLGYFSGTPTHDRDFAEIAAAVAQLMREDARISLLVVGPLDPGAGIAALADRVERRDTVAWCDLPDLIAECDVSLAPLELGRRFAAAKGEIKYLEAATVAVPVVASPAAAYRHAIRDGENGFLAAAAGEWHRALATLAADARLRERLGAAALEDASSRYGEASRGLELLEILEQVRHLPLRAAALPAGRARSEVTARVALEPDACPDAIAAVGAADVSPPVPGRSRIAQRFRARRDGLCRVDVQTVTYGIPGAHRLDLSLRGDDGTRVASASVAARDAPDRGWLALEVSPQVGSAGRWYRLEIEVVGESRHEAISFGLGRASEVESARLDGAPLDGSLALRGFAAWPAALAAREAARAANRPAAQGASSPPGEPRP